jgi:hypothetical protein
MTATRMVLALTLTAVVGLACAQLGVISRAQFKIVERFPDRVGEIETLGVEVKSALPDGMVSELNLEKLSAFFSDGLREGGSFGAVVDLTSGGDVKNVGLVVTVHISLLKASSQAERKKGVASHLHGTMSLRNRVTDRSLGVATIWASGSNLNLASNQMPKAVREFAEAMREILH